MYNIFQTPAGERPGHGVCAASFPAKLLPTTTPPREEAVNKPTRTRIANGVLGAVLAVLVCAHQLLGAFAPGTAALGGLRTAMWIAVAALAVHVALSVATTRQMLTDATRPPSSKKKQHQVLKWVSGAAVAMLLAAHVLVQPEPAVRAALLVALAGALAWHLWLGAKSLLKDLGADRRYRIALKTAAVVVAAAVVLGVCAKSFF